MKFTIDRKKWLRGEGAPKSRLLRFTDQKMCCVGFYCLANGISKGDIIERLWPYKSGPESIKWLHKPICTDDRESGRGLSSANDTQSLAEPEREEIITRIFAQNGVEVEFVN